MFALLALGGDVGCSGGPTLVGLISSSLNDNLKAGILAAISFPGTSADRDPALSEDRKNNFKQSPGKSDMKNRSFPGDCSFR